MEFQDKKINCKECGKEFIFSSGEQEFYKEKGLENEPVRCSNCRNKRRRDKGSDSGRREKAMHEITCAQCGQKAKVPFQPKEERPVYCRNCYTNATVKK